jgi:hypothetical protein
MADRPMTDWEREAWLVATRLAAAELHPQNRAFDSYETIRQQAVARGDRAEPIPAGTTFAVVGRKLGPDEV